MTATYFITAGLAIVGLILTAAATFLTARHQPPVWPGNFNLSSDMRTRIKARSVTYWRWAPVTQWLLIAALVVGFAKDLIP